MSRFRCLAVFLVVVATSRALHAADPVGVQKIVSPPVDNAGTNVSYEIRVSQPDGVTAAANVQLTDAVPAQTTFVSAVQNSGPAFNPCTTPAVGASVGTITCTISNIPAGSPDAIFTFTFHIDSIA